MHFQSPHQQVTVKEGLAPRVDFPDEVNATPEWRVAVQLHISANAGAADAPLWRMESLGSSFHRGFDGLGHIAQQGWCHYRLLGCGGELSTT